MLLHYIDPGTGSMLFTILIGVVTAGIYGLRSAFIKLRFVFSGGRQEKVDQTDNPYVVFTDDKRYSNVFEPICDEFEARKLPLRYLTASSDDPALAKEWKAAYAAAAKAAAACLKADGAKAAQNLKG